MTATLIALPKGRLGEETLARLEGTRFQLDEGALQSRALRIPMATPGLEALLVKGSDLPRYVSGGVAALGIVGSDTLDELETDLLELEDLGFGVCRLSLCAPASFTLDQMREKSHLRIATKFPKATARWLADQDLTAELVPLQSSVELAPLLGLADAIVDLVQTGSTLKAHHLQERAVLARTSARLVAGRGAYLGDPAGLAPLARELALALKA